MTLRYKYENINIIFSSSSSDFVKPKSAIIGHVIIVKQREDRIVIKKKTIKVETGPGPRDVAQVIPTFVSSYLV